METKLDFEGLAKTLLARSGEYLTAWLPGGRMVGREYVCGDLRGGPGDSCKVNINTGAWADFAGDDKGGDLISLFAAVQGLKNGEAAKQLADSIGYQLSPHAITRKQKPQDKAIPLPDGMPMPTMEHYRLGKPSAHWVYLNKDLRCLSVVARYDTNSGKEFIPWSWGKNAQKWLPMAWPTPRPLYNSHLLNRYPQRAVMVVEGEKAADAAQIIVGAAYVVVSWPGGAKGTGAANWESIYGRNIIIWPDADKPGVEAGNKIAEILVGQCPVVKLIDPLDQLDKWDAADALKEGWTLEKLKEWAKSRVAIVAKAETVPTKPSIDINLVDASESDASKFALWESLGLQMTKSGQPICNSTNIKRLFNNHEPLKWLVWYDEFYKEIFTKWETGKKRQWKDEDTLKLMMYVQDKIGITKMSDDMVYKACVVYGKEHSRNEPKEWLESLKWDKVDRIGMFLVDAFGAKEFSEYVWTASHNFWLSMVARIYDPGCKVDNMLVLEGNQGIYKSTAMGIIGGAWYTEGRGSVLDKDFLLGLRGKLLVEIADLDAFSRAEVTAIKQVITCRVDRFRSPYGRISEDHPRQSIFVGTTNEKVYLKDSTGGRRFWPITCTRVNHEWIKQNREQLFAEAVNRYKANETWWEMPVDETKEEQESRRHQDAWEEVIHEFLLNKAETTVPELAKDCLGIEIGKLDRLTQMRIGSVLRRVKWEKRNKKWISPEQQKQQQLL